MRCWNLLRRLGGGLFALTLLAACGGGGGGGGGLGGLPAIELARLEASLTGAEETTVTDAEARAGFLVRVMSDGTLEFAAVAQPAWADTIVGMHIHRAPAGLDGPIEVDLLPGGIAFDPSTSTAEGTLEADAGLVAEIAADPGEFYVNIHTAAAPGGFVRGQLREAAPVEWHAELRGEDEVAVADPLAHGAATFLAHPDGRIDYVVALRQPAVGDVIAGHIHTGSAGVDGGVLVDLQLPAAAIDGVAGTLTGSVQADPAVLVRIRNDLASFYTNVHTAAAPGGVARGQLAAGTVGLWAALRGDEESVVVDADARGGATIELETFTTGIATLAVPPAQGIDLVIAAHIHEGAAGTDGGPLVDLLAGADYSTSPPTGSADGSIALDQALFTRLLADPESFYVNAHSAAAPGGLVRGQLSMQPETFFADLSGAEESTVVDAGAAGAADIQMTDVHRCNFTVSMVQPDATLITDAHLHDGAAGVDGPVLVSLLDGEDVAVSGSTITGRAVVSGRTFARLLSSADLFYVNVHSLAAPAGLARGQCGRLSGDIPPAGLVYDSPLVYSTAVAIPNNVPQSAGGAIQGYTVDPALPAGLALDPVTGILSGTPLEAAAQADYTVTASNAAGSTTATLMITVDLSPPASLSYPTPRTYVTGTAITPLLPTSTGGQITNYVVSPALPAGLALGASTGRITGTPTTATPAANYAVTGSNSAGNVQATINITITAALQPPSGLSYSSPVVYTTGSAISANTPTVGGGAVATWSIAPSLPAGLAFSTSTGVISGTPTTVTAQANYTVTAANAAGNTQATVSITVNLGAPTNLTYSPNQGIGYVSGGFFTSMSPSSQGGTVSSYSISPALPAGLSINASTGVIGGTPTALSSQATYTVTATNSAGSATATVVITVLS